MRAVFAVAMMVVGLVYSIMVCIAFFDGLEAYWGLGWWVSLFAFVVINLFRLSILMLIPAFQGIVIVWNWSWWQAALFLFPGLLSSVYFFLPRLWCRSWNISGEYLSAPVRSLTAPRSIRASCGWRCRPSRDGWRGSVSRPASPPEGYGRDPVSTPAVGRANALNHHRRKHVGLSLRGKGAADHVAVVDFRLVLRHPREAVGCQVDVDSFT